MPITEDGFNSPGGWSLCLEISTYFLVESAGLVGGFQCSRPGFNILGLSSCCAVLFGADGSCTVKHLESPWLSITALDHDILWIALGIWQVSCKRHSNGVALFYLTGFRRWSLERQYQLHGLMFPLILFNILMELWMEIIHSFRVGCHQVRTHRERWR